MKFLSKPWMHNVLRGSLIPIAIAGAATSIQCSDAPELDALDGTENVGEVRQAVANCPNGPATCRFASSTKFCDFDGDGKCELTVFRPSTGAWPTWKLGFGEWPSTVWGAPEDISVPGDYDGDGKTDEAIFRPSTGFWAIKCTGHALVINTQWGSATDIPVPGDYDGNGQTDLAYYTPSTGWWTTKNWNSPSVPARQWGAKEDIPVPNDYDGDGKTDHATYRPSIQQWAIKGSTVGDIVKIWGAANDIPVVGDFNGDGLGDYATYNRNTKAYSIQHRNGGSTSVATGSFFDEIPVPADYDGDDKTDCATFRPTTGNWRIFRSTAGFTTQQWGMGEDMPASQIVSFRRTRRRGDFDGDRLTDLTAWRPASGNWATFGSSTGAYLGDVFWGAPEDIPLDGDFDGDGRTDRVTWRPSTGNWAVNGTMSGIWPGVVHGQAGDVPLASDFDGDGKADRIFWTPATGLWKILRSTTGTSFTKTWGNPEDIPVPADFDGDGRGDFATWRPSTGNWAITLAAGGVISTPWGMGGDVPLPGDFDGDGRADLVIYRPSTHLLAVKNSSGGAEWSVTYGTIRELPLVADFDADGKADLGMWRPSDGRWRYRKSKDGVSVTLSAAWGSPEDLPAPHMPGLVSDRRADFDGDGRSDPTAFQSMPRNWLSLESENGNVNYQFGISGDTPLFGDVDGDRRMDRVTWQATSGNWTVRNSRTGTQGTPVGWGASEDIPVMADFDGDRKADRGIYRPSTGLWAIVRTTDSGTTTVSNGGKPEDIPVPTDFDGDGKADYAYWRPSDGTFHVSYAKNPNGTPQVDAWGQFGDIPVPADYDGDRRADRATWRPTTGNWAITLSSTGQVPPVTQWGASEDLPVPGDYDGDGKADIATWRPSTGNFAILRTTLGELNVVKGGVDHIPLPLATPVPWYYTPAALTTLASPTIAVGDSIKTDTYDWEYSATVAAPGTSGCANGMRFLSGTGSANRMYTSSLTCSGSACDSDTMSRITPAAPRATWFIENDNQVVRRRNGELVLVRGLLGPAANDPSADGVWVTSNCGTSWTQRGFIDPTDRTRHPPPEFPGDASASYGTPQGGACTQTDAAGNCTQCGAVQGGWDREEALADPFSDNLYVTFSGNGGQGQNGCGTKYADGRLARSSDGGATWRSIVVPSGGWPPLTMTSVPGRVFLLSCMNSYPFLWWSDDNGATLTSGVRLSYSRRCTGTTYVDANNKPIGRRENSINVGRVSWTSGALGDAVLRVVYPTTILATPPNYPRQFLNVFNVTVSTTGGVSARFVREISDSNRDISQATLVEADPSMVGVSTENASVLYWHDMTRPPAVAKARVNGVLMRNALGFSPTFAVSTVNPTGGGSREYTGFGVYLSSNTPGVAGDTRGDYYKGAFYYDSASNQLRYVLPWIEVNGNTYELRSKTFGFPK